MATRAMRQRRTSIGAKFAILAFVGILLSGGITAGVGVMLIARSRNESSEQILTLTCQQQANQLNQRLLSVENSVNACAEITVEGLGSRKEPDNAELLDEHLSDLEDSIGSIARNTTGVCAYYLRVSPDIQSSAPGFFYIRDVHSDRLMKEPLTDLTLYDENDTEHVGWFYEPKRAGHAVWMQPYHNQNIDVYMVSYVVPLYRQGEFLGVVGMDIDFNLVINAVRHIRTYETGRASLFSKEGVVYYHESLPSGASISELIDGSDELLAQIPQLKPKETGSLSLEMDDGHERKAAFCVLENDTMLLLSVERAEIESPMRELVGMALGVFASVSALITAAVLILSRAITRPLEQLSEAADLIAHENLDVELPKPTNDEVGVLTRSVDVMLRSLRTYISGMHSKAYSDALTGARNKTAYDAACEALEARMDAGRTHFALVMCDVNDLKVINDSYGHNRGDEYLQASYTLISEACAPSQVYRIGGDEFVAVLDKDEYGRLDEVLVRLQDLVEACSSRELPWERVSLAWGAASCDEGDMTPDDVFRRADKAMYEHKRVVKAGRMRR